MQISHQHKLINCSQYGDYCRIDSFGDIPGQVDSLFGSSDSLDDKVRPRSGIWIEFADCEKVSLWRKNGPRSQQQTKLRFSQVFWTLFLVVTLSHNFSKCGNTLQLYEETYLKRRSFSFTVRFCIYFCLSLFSAVVFGDFSMLGFSFKVEVAYIYFQLSQHLASVRNYCIFFHQYSCSFVFIGRWFSRMWWFSKCFSGVNVHLLFFSSATIHMQISTHISQLFERTISVFLIHIFFSHSQQVHEPAYK